MIFPPQTISLLSSYILPSTLALSFDGKWMPSPVFPHAPYTRGQPECLTPLRGKEVELVNEAALPLPLYRKRMAEKKKHSKKRQGKQVFVILLSSVSVWEKLERHFKRASKIIVVNLSQMKKWKQRFACYRLFVFWSLSFDFNIISGYFFYFYFRERKTTITKFSISYFLNIPGLFSSISSFRWGCRRLLIACFLSFFVVCFRIQKERVSEREKDLEVLQEKLAEQVCHSLN